MTRNAAAAAAPRRVTLPAVVAGVWLLCFGQPAAAQEGGRAELRGCVRSTLNEPVQGISIVVRHADGRERIWPALSDFRGDFAVSVDRSSANSAETIEVSVRNDVNRDPGSTPLSITVAPEETTIRLKDCLTVAGYHAVGGTVRFAPAYLPDSGSYAHLIRLTWDEQGQNPQDFWFKPHLTTFTFNTPLREGTHYRAEILRPDENATYDCRIVGTTNIGRVPAQPWGTEPALPIDVVCKPMPKAIALCREARQRKAESDRLLRERIEADGKARGGAIERSASALPERAGNPDDLCAPEELPRRTPGAGLQAFTTPAASSGAKGSHGDESTRSIFSMIGGLAAAVSGGATGAERLDAVRDTLAQFASGGTTGAEVPVVGTGDPDADCKAAAAAMKPKFETGLARAADTVQQLEAYMWLNINAIAIIDRYCPDTAMGRQERANTQRQYAARERTCNGISSRRCVARLPAGAGGAASGGGYEPAGTRTTAPIVNVCTPGASYNAQKCFCQQNPRGAGCPGSR